MTARVPLSDAERLAALRSLTDLDVIEATRSVVAEAPDRFVPGAAGALAQAREGALRTERARLRVRKRR